MAVNVPQSYSQINFVDLVSFSDVRNQICKMHSRVFKLIDECRPEYWVVDFTNQVTIDWHLILEGRSGFQVNRRREWCHVMIGRTAALSQPEGMMLSW
jgi:hypothetical protein